MNPQAHRSPADPRRRPGERRRSPRSARSSTTRTCSTSRPAEVLAVVPRARGRGQRLVHRPGAVRRAARADRDRRRAALGRARDADRRAGSGSPPPSCRSSACCAGRSSCPATRPTATRDAFRHRERHPRHRDRRDARLPADRRLDGARHRRARPALRRPLVRGARRRRPRRWSLVGVLSPLDLPVVDTANFFGYVLWSLWLIAFGVVILRPRAARRAAGAASRGGDVVTRPPALGRARRAVREPARDRRRQHDRQRRAADAGARARRGRQRAAVGGRRLHARVRRPAAAGRRARRPLRAPAHAARRARRCSALASAAAAYAGGVDGADRRPRGDGRGRRVHHARDAVAAGQRVRRRARARDGDRHLGRDRGPRRRARARSSAASCSTTSGGARSSSSTSRCARSRVVVGLRRAARVARPGRAGAIDWTGAALSGAGLRRARVGGHRGAVGGLDVGAACSPPARSPRSRSAPSCVRQRRAAEPLLDVRLFRNPRFTRRERARSWCCSSRSSGSCSCRPSTCSSCSGYSPSAAGVRVLPYAGAMIVFAPLSAKLVARLGTRRVATAGMLLFAAGPGRRRDGRRRARGYGRLAVALRADGRRDGPRGRAGDRVDHGLAAARAGEHRLGGQRHDARARRRARRRRRRQHHVLALRRRELPERRAVGTAQPRARRSCTRCRGRRSSSRSSPRSAP